MIHEKELVKPSWDITGDGKIDDIWVTRSDTLEEHYVGKGLKVERTQDFASRIERLVVDIGSGLTFAADGKLTATADVDAILDIINEKLTEVDERIDEALSKLDNVGLAAVEKRVTALEKNQLVIQSDLNNLKTQFNLLTISQNELMEVISNVVRTINDLNERVTQLEDNNPENIVIEDEIVTSSRITIADDGNVSFDTPMEDTNYKVIGTASNFEAGSVGEVFVSNKTVNGFKIDNTGTKSKLGVIVVPSKSRLPHGTSSFNTSTDVKFDVPLAYSHYGIFITTSQVSDGSVGEVSVINKNRTGLTVTNTGSATLEFDWVIVPYVLDSTNFEVGQITLFGTDTVIKLGEFNTTDYNVFTTITAAAAGTYGDSFINNKTTEQFTITPTGQPVGHTIDYIASV